MMIIQKTDRMLYSYTKEPGGDPAGVWEKEKTHDQRNQYTMSSLN